METLDDLVRAVRRSAHYRAVCPELVEHVGSVELAKRRSFKEALKATKSTLHQVAGSFLESDMRYGAWLDRLREARGEGDEDGYREACTEIMRRQSSTRERLPILTEFYTRALGPIAPVRSVVDIASGLNPLAISWMPLEPGVSFTAYDIYEDLIAFLGEAMPLSGIVAQAECRDVTRLAPTAPVDVALILKAVPCLDRLDRLCASRLLDIVDARHFLISFPVRSLGGREKGMIPTYEARMERLLDGRTWQVSRLEFATELAFLVSR
jgi:16S rRNA (guanine(1405)-N(7))-methyltransferase